MKQLSEYRGSRRHVLEWVDQPGFREEFAALIDSPRIQLDDPATWQPLGITEPTEATLDTFGPKHFPDPLIWDTLAAWWLINRSGARTPTWDLAAPALIEGRRGLVLVEAKANVPELGIGGKPKKGTPSERSAENHDQIVRAVAAASTALAALIPGVKLGITSHYQLASRLAFTWKLASLGVPTVLVYLGFLGDKGISDAGEPFRNAGHWRKALLEHSHGVIPPALWERRLESAAAPFWVVERSRERLSDSPRRAKQTP